MFKFAVSLSIGAFCAAFALPAQAGGLNNSLMAAFPLQTARALPIAETRKGVKQLGGDLGGKLTTTGVSELSAQDCKNVGGKVITVADDRCGASGKYCRMPDTNAVCIDVLN
jgi:putative hemolysin